MDKKLYVDDIDLQDKRVFLRVDYNVPIENHKIQDDYRILCTIPTIEYIISQKVKSLAIGTHLGRPKGKYDFAYSLEPVYVHLRSLFAKIGCVLHFQGFYEDLKGEYVLFDNLRFLQAEESTEEQAKMQDYLKSIADIVVLDAFGCVHREAGSITRTNLPTYGGLLLKKEMQYACDLTSAKKDIDLIILGGKKVKDKITLIKGLIRKTKNIFVCGGMCFTFLKAFDKDIGDTAYEQESLGLVSELYEYAKSQNTNIILPDDFVGLHDNEYKDFDFVTKPYVGVDIGPKTVYYLTKIIAESTKIFWNGPPGIFEQEGSSHGTAGVVRALAAKTSNGGTIIVGGGDTVAALTKFVDRTQYTHVSTGGGSLLSILEGKELPGIAILQERK